MPNSVYVYHRSILYSLLWVASVIELGLTGWRVHHTKSVAGFYDPIVVELIVTAVLSILWIPITVFLHVRKSRELNPGSGYTPLGFESCGNSILWVMWLIGAAIATHKWPTKGLAGPGKDGHLLLALVAFAWIPFGVLTLIKVFVAMHYAALRGGADAAPHSSSADEKRSTAA